MDTLRFDTLTRAVASVLSRRTLAGALGLSVLSLPSEIEAKKQRQKRKNKKKVKRNEFGCVNVGGFCKNGGQCCSGICEGKKGKKKCKAHDQSTCQAGQDVCLGVETACTTGAGAEGACTITTGKASFCFGGSGDCFPCEKDANCEPFCGAGAACIVCAECAEEGLQTACVGLNADSCEFPL